VCVEKLVIVAISLSIFCGDGTFCLYKYFSNLGRKCIMCEDIITTSDHIGLKQRHIVRILRNGRRIKRVTEFA